MGNLGWQMWVLGPALFLLAAAWQAQAQGHAPSTFTLTKSETLVEGVLLEKGRPVSSALLTSCGDYNAIPGMARSKSKCESPIELRTDAAGRFKFYQMSGEKSFTCRNPCAADPHSDVWFDVRIDGRTYRAHEMERGFLYVGNAT